MYKREEEKKKKENWRIGCPKMSVTNYESALRNISKDLIYTTSEGWRAVLNIPWTCIYTSACPSHRYSGQNQTMHFAYITLLWVFLLCKLFDDAGNRTCDHVTGEYVCRAGYIGLTCEHPCPVGTYGLNCLEKCTCKNGADCHHVTGQFEASVCSCTVHVMVIGASACSCTVHMMVTGASACSCTVHVMVMLSCHGDVYWPKSAICINGML